MSLNSLNTILADAAPGQQAPVWMNYFIFIPMFVIFYVLLIRPQSKKAKQLAEMLKTMKPGDKVIAGSGIVGIVVSVKERTVAIRSADTKLEFLKSAVTEITERAGETAVVES